MNNLKRSIIKMDLRNAFDLLWKKVVNSDTIQTA